MMRERQKESNKEKIENESHTRERWLRKSERDRVREVQARRTDCRTDKREETRLKDSHWR